MAIVYQSSSIDWRAGTSTLNAQLANINTFIDSNKLLAWDIENEFIAGIFNDAQSGTTQLKGFKAESDANVTAWIQSLNSPTQLVKMVLVEDFVLIEYTPNV